MNVSWLDRAVGTENFPDGDWLEQRILDTPIIDRSNFIGFDNFGRPIFQDPSNPHMGSVITQGAINTAALQQPVTMSFSTKDLNLDAMKMIWGAAAQYLDPKVRLRSNGT